MTANPLLIIVVVLWLIAPLPSRAEAVRTQRIPLRTGWNAVFLEVAPTLSKLAQVFANLPVETVAAYFPTQLPVYFPRDPEEHPWQDEDWRVWYAPSRPDAFLSNLHALQANQAYLIQATSDCVLEVSGRVEFNSIQWRPDSLNFIGFSVDPLSPPTFQRFFEGANAHQRGRYFRLEEGRWTLVRDSAATTIRRGEAYWIECRGGSDFQGPLTVRLPAGRVLDFGAQGNDLRVEFQNRAVDPARVSVETFRGTGILPLARVEKDWHSLQVTYPDLPPALELPLIPAGQTEFLRLAARREAMAGPDASALLRISSDQGVQLWIPVTAASPAQLP